MNIKHIYLYVCTNEYIWNVAPAAPSRKVITLPLEKHVISQTPNHPKHFLSGLQLQTVMVNWLGKGSLHVEYIRKTVVEMEDTYANLEHLTFQDFSFSR